MLEEIKFSTKNVSFDFFIKLILTANNIKNPFSATKNDFLNFFARHKELSFKNASRNILSAH